MPQSLVLSLPDILRNVKALFDYGNSDIVFQRDFHNKRIKNGKLFVIARIEDKVMFSPSKFSGYLINDINHAELLSERDGRKTNRAITSVCGAPIGSENSRYREIDDQFILYCQKHEIEPSKHHLERRYWILENSEYIELGDEIKGDNIYEGAKKTILVNRFERSREARDLCLAKFGYGCSVCGIDLAHVYGSIAENFIHVHHLVPLSTISREYVIDPTSDLRPVCPNCHSMLHRREVPYSIEELKAIISVQSGKCRLEA